MADEDETESEEPKKGSKKPLLIGLVLALVLGGGGFYAVWSGLVLAPVATEGEKTPAEVAPMSVVAFVPVPPLVVNVGIGNQRRHLRFQAQLEVTPGYEEEVAKLLPRVVDVLNGYLRAVDPPELERKTALIKLRAQMLRRVQVVTGQGRVRDLLIMEFVLN